MKYNYGGHTASIDGVYEIDGKSKLKVLDITKGFWGEWLQSDVVFIDFPYDNRMIKHYYEQIDQVTDLTYDKLQERAFEIIANISPKHVFVEVGKRNVHKVEAGLKEIGYETYTHDSFYAKTSPCFIVEGCRPGDEPVNIPIAGIDELEAIENICNELDFDCITDFFNGQGAVSRYAYAAGKRFVCSELNPNRAGKALYDLKKMGAKIEHRMND